MRPKLKYSAGPNASARVRDLKAFAILFQTSALAAVATTRDANRDGIYCVLMNAMAAARPHGRAPETVGSATGQMSLGPERARVALENHFDTLLALGRVDRVRAPAAVALRRTETARRKAVAVPAVGAVAEKKPNQR